MAKDLRLAIESAAEQSLDLPQTKLLTAIYQQATDAGWQEDDFIGLIRLLENQARRADPKVLE
jgi:2-hydroxy-3-oxopropionate reductase